MEIKYLYETYKNDVYSYLISLTHDKTLSEDLTSETFLTAIKSIHTFKGKSSIKTWLFSIARYKWYGVIRKAHDIPTQDELLLNFAEKELLTDEKVLEKELISRIYTLLDEENLIKREILLMRVDGYSFYEIALKYSISESSARVIDFRLRTKIKRILTKEGFDYE